MQCRSARPLAPSSISTAVSATGIGWLLSPVITSAPARSLRPASGRCSYAASARHTAQRDFERLTTAGLRTSAGRSESDLAALGERLFAHVITGSLHREGDGWPRTHHRAGHNLEVASAVTRFQVEPAAKALGMTHPGIAGGNGERHLQRPPGRPATVA
jgi:phosphoserine phosphatase